ncbi:helix-turn-helix transcriptional regulator [Nocardia alni]|uniref:helix-turn-helix transcriptional regulator n=1 Tax=Nocardia alni TaxID=2815723 RepID=UPI001C21BC67|nr:LuxR C-terminal-related transcriptional regulator [Nocardia alni]
MRESVDTLMRLDDDLRRNLQLGIRPRQAVTVSEALFTTEEIIASALAAIPAKSDAVAIERAQLITALLAAQSETHRLLLQAAATRVAAVGPSITRLRATASIRDLTRQLCTELTGGLEFRCASYSVINFDSCTTHWMHPHSDHTGAQGGAERQLSPEETRCIRRQRSTIVDASPGGREEPMATLLGASNFVVTPVIIRSRVHALIHAARDLPWTVDDTDAQLLEVVASAFAVIHQREELADRMESQQQAIYTAAQQLVADAQTLAEGGYPDLGIEGGADSQLRQSVEANVALKEILTPREFDVLRLIVAGASNTEIAEQLVIAVETVKSHVKRILRKLGAVNRSEVISLYLAQRGSPS